MNLFIECPTLDVRYKQKKKTKLLVKIEIEICEKILFINNVKLVH